MENPRMSEETQEQYVDAAVAVFMEQYSNALDESTLQETQDEIFPEELDERCKNLIEKERDKRRRKKILQTCMRMGRRAAVVVLVLLCVGTTLFFTVESFRQPIMNQYIEWKNGYVKVSSFHDNLGNKLDLNNPLGEILGEEYKLDYIENAWGTGTLMADYEGPDKDVFLGVDSLHGVLILDTEDSEITSTYVFSYEVMVITKGNRITLSWIDEQKNRVYTLIAHNFTLEEIVDLCAEVIMLFEE